MSKFITKFETNAAYKAAESGLFLPNVSYCVAENEVHYKPYIPQHEYVEINGIKWATMNVGANSVTDAGLLFQWGDTQGYTAEQIGDGKGQKAFTLDDYKYDYNYESTEYTKYNMEDGLIKLQTGDDAVTAAWGGNWRTPTVSEFVNLGEAVNTEWTSNYQGSGIAGLICTDKTDSSKVLFFPACGYALEGNVHDANSDGYYWSSSISDYMTVAAMPLKFYDSFVTSEYFERYYGMSIRGILNE